jgi:hypothetical protein
MLIKTQLKTPVIKENTFIVWEPCSKSHAEVVPGFVKYFVDLGYHVSVLVDKDRLKEGLFSRYDLENISLNKMSADEIKTYFKESDLSNVQGVLVTTMGKICDCENQDTIYDLLLASLIKINEGYDPMVITNILELKYLDYLGVMPVLNECSICGNKNNIVTLSVDKGGYICSDCFNHENESNKTKNTHY